MSNSVIQVCYLGVLKPNKIYTDLEDPIEVKFLGESAEVNSKTNVSNVGTITWYCRKV